MSENRSPEVQFKCLNDCQSFGCPGHNVSAILNNSTDVLRFEFSDKFDQIFIDQNAFEAMTKAYADCPVRTAAVSEPATLETLAPKTTIESPSEVSVPPRPSAEPIPRRPKKLSKREQAIEARRQSDPLGRDRDDIDYSDDSLPTARIT